jgi:hypothetical protein
MVLLDPFNGDVERRVAVEGIGAMQGPVWSPDGRSVVFSGSKGGITDLFIYDLPTETTTQLTRDKNADFQPAFSPDGRTVAFVSDRGEMTDFDRLSYSKFQIALLDLETGEVRTLDLFGETVKHINPQYSPDGEELYFISDPDGFSNIYRLRLADGQIERITNVATAVSGITWSAPAMTVAQLSGKIVFSVFDEFEYHVYTLTAEEADERAEVVVVTEPGPGRNLVPTDPRVPSRVEVYLDDYDTGLEPPGTYLVEDAEAFESSLQLDFIGQPTIGVGADAFGTYLGGSASAYFSDMLGDRFLWVAIAAQGTVKDLGGQVYYMNQKDRWNWGYGIGRVPYSFFQYNYGQIQDGNSGNVYRTFNQTRYRIYNDYATGILAYPFSLTRRVEANLGFLRYSYDIEQEQYILDDFGNTIDQRRIQLDDDEPDPQNLFQASLALVGDNSFSAFTGPVRGGRYRIEVETTRGTSDFETITLDWRRYFSPNMNLTFAIRGMHYGRYNYTEEAVNNSFIRPIFLGYETLIRGYAWESFENYECGGSSCPVFDRLWGQKVMLTNFEVRVPFLGTEQFGLLDLPYIPMELVAFTDIGVAFDDWSPAADDPDGVQWTFARDTDARVPVVSSGFGARFNILGVMILEAYYAYPFQRPDKGWHWGFNLAPGW